MIAITSAETVKPGRLLAEKLRFARLAEGAHHAAIVDIRDASVLRLQLLKDAIEPEIAGARAAGGFTDLALVADYPPRLWIDMVSYVVMAPDPRTYRFQRDTRTGHQALCETGSLDEMAECVISYMAHRLIEYQRRGEEAPAEMPSTSSGNASLLLAWLSGLTAGIFAVLIAFILLRIV
jgi:hypothetical protein